MTRRQASPPLAPFDVLQDFLQRLRAGDFLETAALVSGLRPKDVIAWMRQGLDDERKKRETVYTVFRSQVKTAIAQAEEHFALIISKAAEKNWHAAAWRLERLRPTRWGQVQKTKTEEKPKIQVINLNHFFEEGQEEKK